MPSYCNIQARPNRSQISDDRLRSLVDDVYEAAQEPELFGDCLRRIAELLNSRAAFSTALAPADAATVVHHHHGIPDEMWALYETHYVGVDPRFSELCRLPSNTPVADQDFIQERQMDQHEYYAEFLAPGDFRYSISSLAVATPKCFQGFTLQRSRNEGPIEGDDRRAFQVLAPHVNRSLAFQVRLAEMRADRLVALEGLNRSVDAIFLADGGGRIAWMNARAETVVNRGDGLSVEHGQLVTSHLGDRDRLAALISGTSAPGLKPVGEDTMPIRRPSGREAFAMRAYPLTGDHGALRLSHAGTVHATVMVIVAIPDDQVFPSSGELSAIFEFTPAEARVAAAILDGMTVEDCVRAFRVSRETVRSQLKTVMAKAGVHRQADLVRILLSAVGSRWT